MTPLCCYLICLVSNLPCTWFSIATATMVKNRDLMILRFEIKFSLKHTSDFHSPQSTIEIMFCSEFADFRCVGSFGTWCQVDLYRKTGKKIFFLKKISSSFCNIFMNSIQNHFIRNNEDMVRLMMLVDYYFFQFCLKSAVLLFCQNISRVPRLLSADYWALEDCSSRSTVLSTEHRILSSVVVLSNYQIKLSKSSQLKHKSNQ